MSNNNIHWHNSSITRENREEVTEHKGICLWFTGLSGSGKSSLANKVEFALNKKRIHTYLLDGDNIRHGLNKGLGFSSGDRKENIRRIGEVANLFVDAGIVVLTAFISPYREDRNRVRQTLPKDKFIEIYVECDLETCEQRDPKGLYKKARSGEIADFTGVNSPYEAPENPEFVINNDKGCDLNKNVEKIISFVENKIML